MDRSALTPHARVRMQQRGIRAAALDALLEYGVERYVHSQGREIVFLDKKARARLARQSPEGARAAERLGRTYAIVGDGVVITVGHRYRRIPRD
ncbi:MAG TPA: hypothetical protein VGP71_01240 [Burkholderiales bacterium]|jgi:hypothetical protein|nr:hypothetical protein [Burkholderiales bacterium]